jgi:large subunit ribosomal protein L2
MLKNYRPISPSLRHKPEKSLAVKITKTGGRTNGKVTAGTKSGGHKRKFRLIDFKRNKRDVPAKVAAIEYDPNRSSNIALLHFKDGEKRYILAPTGLKVGENVTSGESGDIRPGNALPLAKIPVGTVVHNIELIHVKLTSKEVRKIHITCYATIGQVGNLDWKNVSFGKAGKSRHRGIKPHVRGVAMDPRSHPHGGGEAKSGEGMHPKTPTGKPARGKKTRSKNKPSSKFIVSRRKK